MEKKDSSLETMMVFGATRFKDAAVGTMLGPSAADSFGDGLELLVKAGAQVVTGGKRGG